MKKTFNPQIFTKNADLIVDLFEKLGFENRQIGGADLFFRIRYQSDPAYPEMSRCRLLHQKAIKKESFTR